MSGGPIAFDATQPAANMRDRDPSIDQISLEQALIDAQIANERIVAVTLLIEAKSAELTALREQLAHAQRELAVIEATA